MDKVLVRSGSCRMVTLNVEPLKVASTNQLLVQDIASNVVGLKCL